ncbi:hypothetical protein C0995_001728 [Termitomyces sp. Mi166|nr:hypothetical protein C0995_001728 [Termitomyces sp. Mi166\
MLCLTRHSQEVSDIQTQVQSFHPSDDLLECRTQFNNVNDIKDEHYLLAGELKSKNKEICELNLALNHTMEEMAVFIQQRDDAMHNCEMLQDQLLNKQTQLASATAKLGHQQTQLAAVMAERDHLAPPFLLVLLSAL